MWRLLVLAEAAKQPLQPDARCEVPCSSHGKCIAGACWCESPYVGADCSLRLDLVSKVSLLRAADEPTAVEDPADKPPPITSTAMPAAPPAAPADTGSGFQKWLEKGASNWLDPFALQPSTLLLQLLIFAIAIVVVVFLWAFRQRLIFLLTGDPKLHFDLCDVVWKGIFQCCGCCTGRWCEKLCGRNLKKALGQCLGVAPYQVVLTQLTLGNLGQLKQTMELEKGADLYIAVESGCHPEVTTSVNDNASGGELVGFSDTLALAVRDSYWAGDVVFYVKDLDVFGSDTLFELRVPSRRVVALAHATEKRKFLLSRKFGGANPEVKPWLAFQLDLHDAQEASDRRADTLKMLRTTSLTFTK